MRSHYFSTLIAAVLLSLAGCEDFVEVESPRTELVKPTVFSSDITAEAAIADLYFTLRSASFADGSLFSVSFIGSLLSDEGVHYYPSFVADLDQINSNDITPDNIVVSQMWDNFFRIIYKTNAIVEGLQSSSAITTETRTKFLGEARFIRALCYFYMVNLWGDVPLVVTTNYQENKKVQRSSQSIIYEQIISDLLFAEENLPVEYATAGRVRVNSFGASALLARVYLYQNEWTKAEQKATFLISNSNQYQLSENLKLVFRTTSEEAILQLWSNVYPKEISFYRMWTAVPSSALLRDTFIESFEAGDQRWSQWGGTVSGPDQQYHYVVKYEDFSIPPLDHTTILRLAEQYLIRAEARAMNGDFPGARADINIIRNRAGLPSIGEDDVESLIDVILQERRSEFFTEWGHRWLDLKRLRKAEEVLRPVKGDWLEKYQLLPIPESQLTQGPMVQNPGY